MKFSIPTSFTMAALLVASPVAMAGKSKSGDLEGEITFEDGDCQLECEWKAKYDRRHLLGSQPKAFIKTKDGRRLGGSVVLQDVTCTLTTLDAFGHEVEIEQDIDFPDGWVQVDTDVDDADDFYFFGTSFDIYYEDGVTVAATAELEVELNYIEDDEEKGDFVEYDDSAIGAECIIPGAAP
jgi:hypothetical protein